MNEYLYTDKETKDRVGTHFSEVSEGMTLLDVQAIEKAVMVLSVVRRNGGTVYLFGNGGSHTTASHFANDLLKVSRLKAVCIGDMTSSMLAYGNDDGWKNMFSNPLKEMLRERDGVVGISCSGNSENVVSGLRVAIDEGILAVGLTGMSESSEINKIGVNALVHTLGVSDIRVQEDLHLMVCHAIVRGLQEIV